MPENIRFMGKRGPKPVGELLTDVQTGKRWIFKLITGVGRLVPGEAQENTLKPFIDGFEFLGSLIEDITKYLESQEDEMADQSVIGARKVSHLERVYAYRGQQQERLAERIRLMKEAESKIIPYSRLQQKQQARDRMIQEQESFPKGAA